MSSISDAWLWQTLITDCCFLLFMNLIWGCWCVWSFFSLLISSGSLQTLRKEGSLYDTENENTAFTWYEHTCLWAYSFCFCSGSFYWLWIFAMLHNLEKKSNCKLLRLNKILLVFRKIRNINIVIVQLFHFTVK